MTPDFIGRYDIDTSLCDSIIGEFERLKVHHIDRTKEFYGYTLLSEEWDRPGNINQEIKDQYFKELRRCTNNYVEEYEFSNKKKNYFTSDAHINVQMYKPGEFYSDWHCENSGYLPHEIRHLVFMTYLNDVHEGGETEFYYQKLKIKPKRGLTLIWPTTWPWTHRGLPAPKEKKYITTGWYIFTTWRGVENDERC